MSWVTHKFNAEKFKEVFWEETLLSRSEQEKVSQCSGHAMPLCFSAVLSKDEIPISGGIPQSRNVGKAVSKLGMKLT